MLRRVGFGAAVVASLALNCGGESERVTDASGGTSAGRAALTGGAGKPAGAAGCLPCSAGRSGASGSGGTDVGNGGVDDGARGGSSGHGGDKPGTLQGGKTGAGGGAGQGGTLGGNTAMSGGRAGAATGGSATGGRGGSSGKGGALSDGGAAGEPNPLAGKVTLARIALYQAVEVLLMKGGVDPTPNAPIIADRDALVRVWLAPDSNWAPRTIEAELTVVHGGISRTATLDFDVTGPSDDMDLATTLDFSLRDTEVQDDTTLALTLHETTPEATELGHWPATGARALGSSSSKGPFLVTLVPLVVNGITPDASVATVNRYQRYLSYIYPVSGANISVRDPVSLSFDVAPDGTGWDDALDELYAARDADDPPANVYYYGLLTPAPTYAEFCADGCVVGLSTVATRTEEQYRGAIGTDYFESSTDTFSQETLAHELGHALGRDHAPCGGPDGVDRKYPYKNGQIGVTGYDGTNLLDRDDEKDVMSYCVPVWISDYTYSGVFTRINYVNGLVQKSVPAQRSARVHYQTLTLRGDGSIHWGREKAPASAPAGEPRDVEVLDAAGALLDVVQAPFAPLDHLAGGFLSVPSSVLARADVASVRVDGQVLAVRP